jgi:hypothetical protein
MRRYFRPLHTIAIALLLAAGLSACNDGNSGPVDPNPTDDWVVVLSGDILGNRTLSADSIYVVTGFLEVQPGATLTIPAGTELISDLNTKGTIVTLRASGDQPSGRLVVNGTPAAPVTFQPGTEATAGSLSPAQVTSCSRGEGGGVILHGDAPINQAVGLSEGVSRPFGGDNPTDDSGNINYLVIVCGGVKVTPDNEINGLTLAGTGSGTGIHFVQAHLIADDGFEWFGGTTNADHLISSGNDDDGLDCDFGWAGTVQFAVVVQDRDLANRGFECDNDADGSALTPITAPNFWNVTWVGAGVLVANGDVNDGLFIRRNSAPVVRNAIVANFGNAGIVIDGSGSQAQATGGALALSNILFFQNKLLAPEAAAMQAASGCAAQNIGFRTSGAYAPAPPFTGGTTFLCADPNFGSVNLTDPINGTTPNLVPQAGSPALVAANAAQPTGSGIVDAGARYLGAFNAADWTAPWSAWVNAQ